MSFLLDADTVTRALKKVPAVAHRVLQHGGKLFLSAVSLAELEMWIVLPQTPTRFARIYLHFLRDLILLPVDEHVARRAGRVGSHLRMHKQRMATADLLIGCTALVHGLTLVTRGTTHWSRVPGLATADWTVP